MISDIDDTIKVAHVLDIDEALKNGFRTQNVFRGMPELYQQLFLINPDISFHYVSNALQTFMQRSHRQFLDEHKFPLGSIWLRKGISETQHKIKTIQTILSDSNVKTAILIGDNGQQDPDIYEEVTRRFPQIQIFTFIRQVYSSKSSISEQRGHLLRKGQIGFVSPLEIAIPLSETGLIQNFQTRFLVDSFTADTLAMSDFEDSSGNSGLISFPNWMDCRDHVLNPIFLKKNFKLSKLLIDRIRERCSRPGLSI